MQDFETARLHAIYLRTVAAIRAFEPELRTTLLDPLALIPGIVRADWRIKSWEAALAKLSHERRRGVGSFDPADISDMLGVRVIIADRRAAAAVRDLVAQAFDVVDDVRYHNPGGPRPFFREHLAVAARGEGDTSIRIEVQVLSRVAQAIINAEHALVYGHDHASPSMSDLSTAMLGPGTSATRLSKAAKKAAGITAKLDSIIDTFEAMIADAGVHEKRDIHPYLDEHRFLLHAGPDSIVSEPPIGLGTQYRLDFIIREPTGEYVLVELENPRHALFTGRGDPTAGVTHAVQQVEDWQEWIEQNIQTVQRTYPDMLSPAGLVVIGRSGPLTIGEKQKLARRNINMRGRLRIETYDEIVTRARTYVAQMRAILNS